ncbi:MAG: glucosaminidase domain-containing protein [Gammaproteobacteria bacterium]|nr:glucosaminidase domain-containing protein [Gammaproteobacteria bacterium]
MQSTLPGGSIGFSRFADLRGLAREDAAGALAEVADEFEALFVEIMLKAARDAQMDDGLFDSNELDTYREMLDQQIAITMARNHDLGIGDILMQQFDGFVAPQKAATASTRGPPREGDKDGFAALLAPLAVDAARKLGVSPRGLIAQAALESGWGRHLIRHPDGRSSHNYFGVKADARWAGEVVHVPTTEFIGGRAVTVKAAFRSYDSAAAAFDDYVDFMRDNPRYQRVLAEGRDEERFAAQLASAGYATDPNYAEKIVAILDTGDWARYDGLEHGSVN